MGSLNRKLQYHFSTEIVARRGHSRPKPWRKLLLICSLLLHLKDFAECGPTIVLLVLYRHRWHSVETLDYVSEHLQIIKDYSLAAQKQTIYEASERRKDIGFLWVFKIKIPVLYFTF